MNKNVKSTINYSNKRLLQNYMYNNQWMTDDVFPLSNRLCFGCVYIYT